MTATTTPAIDPAGPTPPPAARTNPSTKERAELSALLEDLTRQHAPQGAAEAHRVRQMAMTMLRQTWADALERRLVETALSGQPSPALPSASVLPRWRSRMRRIFTTPPASSPPARPSAVRMPQPTPWPKSTATTPPSWPSSTAIRKPRWPA